MTLRSLTLLTVFTSGSTLTGCWTSVPACCTWGGTRKQVFYVLSGWPISSKLFCMYLALVLLHIRFLPSVGIVLTVQRLKPTATRLLVRDLCSRINTPKLGFISLVFVMGHPSRLITSKIPSRPLTLIGLTVLAFADSTRAIQSISGALPLPIATSAT